MPLLYELLYRKDNNMKKVGFIGVYDKTDLILDISKLLTRNGKKVLFIDSTKDQKAKYIVPNILPTVSYVTTFEDIDVAIGFENIEQIEHYLGVDNENELDNYLFIMTRNIILNIFKHQQIEREYQEGYLEKTVLHELIEGEDALNNIYYEEMLLVVRLTLEKMPERRRLIFELSRFKGLSYKEIAEKLNVSIRTVEHQVYLALIELKKVLLFLFFLFSFK